MEQEPARRVIIVDDNPFSRQLLRKLFETHGYRVAGSARGVKEATELYRTKKPDFVTLDLVMDNEHGFRTLMALKRIDPKVRVIIISSDSHQATMEQAQNLGAVGYLVKPVQWEPLKEALDQAGKT